LLRSYQREARGPDIYPSWDKNMAYKKLFFALTIAAVVMSMGALCKGGGGGGYSTSGAPTPPSSTAPLYH